MIALLYVYIILNYDGKFSFQRIAKLEEESILELELDYDGDENEEEVQERVDERSEGDYDEDDEQGREEQEELRNNLKNLDFKDQEMDLAGGTDKKRSALAQVLPFLYSI